MIFQHVGVSVAVEVHVTARGGDLVFFVASRPSSMSYCFLLHGVPIVLMPVGLVAVPKHSPDETLAPFWLMVRVGDPGRRRNGIERFRTFRTGGGGLTPARRHPKRKTTNKWTNFLLSGNLRRTGHRSTAVVRPLSFLSAFLSRSQRRSAFLEVFPCRRVFAAIN